jgi:hypothetical protein
MAELDQPSMPLVDTMSFELLLGAMMHVVGLFSLLSLSGEPSASYSIVETDLDREFRRLVIHLNA